MKILEHVCSYRLELGLLLEKLILSYNMVMLQQFEEFYSSENQKEKELR
jgi:hypothetical protein